MIRYLIGGLVLLAGVLFYLVQAEHTSARQPDATPVVAPAPAPEGWRAMAPHLAESTIQPPPLDPKPAPRPGESAEHFQFRQETTLALVAWMDRVSLSEADRERFMLALYDATARYWLAAESLGVLRREEKLSEMSGARLTLDGMIRGLVSREAYIDLMRSAPPAILMSAEIADPEEARTMFREMYGPKR